MSATASTRKRKAEDAPKSTSLQGSCALCVQPFDNAERMPRVLACHHVYCTSCLVARMHQFDREEVRCFKIVCPIDERETLVENGDAKTLTATDGVFAFEVPLRIYVRNMGGESTSLIVTPDERVGELKMRLQALRADYAAHLQRWSIVSDEDTGAFETLENSRTIRSCDVSNGSAMVLTIVDGFRGGDFIRTLISFQTTQPADICISSDGELLCVADARQRRIVLLRSADGSIVEMIANTYENGMVKVVKPTRTCFSPNGQELFVVDEGVHRISVFSVSDGAFLRAFGSKGDAGGQFLRPCDACFSPCGGFLFVCEDAGSRVQIVNAVDGKHIRSISICAPDSVLESTSTSRAPCPPIRASPSGMCLSPDGELLFVSDRAHHVVHVLRSSDGARVRTIGSSGEDNGQFKSPSHVCVSPSGEWLFVADRGNGRVQVFHTSNGEHSHSFGVVNPRADAHEVFAGSPCELTCSPDGKHLFVADSEGNVHVVSA